jgi:hypothetical protein
VTCALVVLSQLLQAGCRISSWDWYEESGDNTPHITPVEGHVDDVITIGRVNTNPSYIVEIGLVEQEIIDTDSFVVHFRIVEGTSSGECTYGQYNLGWFEVLPPEG